MNRGFWLFLALHPAVASAETQEQQQQERKSPLRAIIDNDDITPGGGLDAVQDPLAQEQESGQEPESGETHAAP